VSGTKINKSSLLAMMITGWRIIPGAKAIEAAAAVKGLAIFPVLSAEQREQGGLIPSAAVAANAKSPENR